MRKEFIYTMCCTIPWEDTHARLLRGMKQVSLESSIGSQCVRVSLRPVSLSFPHFIINQWKTSHARNFRRKPELFLPRGRSVTWSSPPITRHASCDKSGLSRASIHACDIMNLTQWVCLCGFVWVFPQWMFHQVRHGPLGDPHNSHNICFLAYQSSENQTHYKNWKGL